MAKAILKQPMSFHVLEEFGPEVLKRLLEPHRDSLKQFELSLDDKLDTEWRQRFFRALQDVDAELSPELRDSLAQVETLATDWGHDQLLEQAGEHGIDITPGMRPTPADLAAIALLDHPQLFREAHTRAAATRVSRFVDFVPFETEFSPPSVSEDTRSLLIGELKTYFDSQNRSDYCDVLVHDSANDTTFLIIHGQPPKQQGVIRGNKRVITRYLPDKHDIAVFSKETGRLSINARYAKEISRYREAIGAALFSDEQWFMKGDIYTAEPIRNGPEALSSQGIAGLDWVRLTELRIVSEHRQRYRSQHAADDLFDPQIVGAWRGALSLGSPTQMKLRYQLTGERRARVLELTTPDRLDFDRRYGADVVYEFLKRRGFMRDLSRAANVLTNAG